MKYIGYACLALGGLLVALFLLKHLIVFLISGSPYLLKVGIIFVGVGLAALIASAFIKGKSEAD